MTRPADPTPVGVGLRLDKWLWFARFARTRSLAAKLCAAGQVRVSGSAAVKPHHLVRVGDRITVTQGRWERSVVVLALGQRRGPPVEARLLYDEPAPPVALARDSVAWIPLIDEDAFDTP